MLDETNVCPDTPRSEIHNIAKFAHDKGFLYTNRKANTFVCGYRIPEVSDKWKNTIPQEEKGEIFFVNFAVSEEPNKWTMLRMLREYLKANSDVKELCYYRRNSDKDFKRIILRRNQNG
jgi:hypothetical protein